MNKIEITFSDDNETEAPLYHKHPQQCQPQRGYLRFDPAADELKLDAGYNAENGGMPANVWNRVVLWFSVPANTSRRAIEGLADNEELAGLLEIIKAEYEYDYERQRGRYTPEAEDAINEIHGMLEGIDQVSVWDAGDWVSEGAPSAADLVLAGSVEKCAEEFDSPDADQVVIGNIAEAVAKAIAGRINSDPDERSGTEITAVVLLIAYDSEYEYLQS